jgi:MFS superfamily sulfate permease-like transporter
VFGPSKVLVLGPDSSVSPLILAAILPLIVTNDPASAIALAGMMAVMVGLIEIGLGVAKLGFVADLLSSEVRVGYLNGLAITIVVGQLPKMFGFSTDADSFIGEVRSFFNGLDQTNRTTLVTGLCVLGVLLILPRITRRVPAVLVAVVGVTLVSAVLDLAGRGVKTVGTLPQGVPVPTLPWTKWSDVGPLVVGAVGITLVSLTDTIATAPVSPPGGATTSTPTRRWSASAPRISPPASFRALPSPSAGPARQWPTSQGPRRR